MVGRKKPVTSIKPPTVKGKASSSNKPVLSQLNGTSQKCCEEEISFELAKLRDENKLLETTLREVCLRFFLSSISEVQQSTSPSLFQIQKDVEHQALSKQLAEKTRECTDLRTKLEKQTVQLKEILSDLGNNLCTQKFQNGQPPADFCCPITFQIMVDPVILADGHTYDRPRITEWLTTKSTSPMTGQILPTKVMIPNLTLKKVIEAWKQKHCIVID